MFCKYWRWKCALWKRALINWISCVFEGQTHDISRYGFTDNILHRKLFILVAFFFHNIILVFLFLFPCIDMIYECVRNGMTWNCIATAKTHTKHDYKRDRALLHCSIGTQSMWNCIEPTLTFGNGIKVDRIQCSTNDTQYKSNRKDFME